MSSSRSRFRIKRLVIVSLLLLFAVPVAVWFGGRWYLQHSVMPMSGEFEMPGLSADTEIFFDDRGIPRIYSQTNEDALRALGWLHAGERLFQMELIRKATRGEISEIVGSNGLEMDVLQRQLGFARRVEQEPSGVLPAVEPLLEAYVDGINRYLQSQPLPPSFRFLGIEPEPWQVDDVRALAYYQTWYPQTVWRRLGESRRRIGNAIGDSVSEWLLSNHNWGIASVPNTRMTDASNTWVVAPEKSTSGSALHAADPHLDLTTAPGLWYAVGLHSAEGLNAVGVSLPGFPFIAMGHNGQIAFACTNAPVDLLEWYRLPLDDSNGDFVIGPNGREPVSRRTERFALRGGDDVVEREIATTSRGIVLREHDDELIVMHWAGLDLPADGLINAAFKLNQAQNFDQFRAATSDMGAFSVNWSYSDRAGNIGFVQSSPIPKRLHRQFFQTLDGTVAENFWGGYIAPENRPFVLNPDQHWLANSNNHAVIEQNGWPVPGFYAHLRMLRASRLLEQEHALSPADMVRMQLELGSERAVQWKTLLADVAERAERASVATGLRAWDGKMTGESEQAGLFALWWQFLPEHLFEGGELNDWQDGQRLLDHWMNDPPEDFELSGMAVERAAELALADALEVGIRPLGDIQSLTVRHPLASVDILDRWLDLSRGPIAMGGSSATLNASYPRWNPEEDRFAVSIGASMRFVMDWADPDAFSMNLTMGQSGHPLSPHFDDFFSDFLSGQPWTVPFDRDRVIQQAASRLTLSPATKAAGIRED